MPFLQCEVTDGPRGGYKSVGVPSIEGFMEYLSIEERFLVREGDQYLLPVRRVGKDRTHNTALVQLPVEADSGANRVWVRNSLLVEAANEVPA